MQKNSDDLICPKCHQFFDENDRIPLLVPDCGHTFCKCCIDLLLMDKVGFTCPEDRNQYLFKRDLTCFPTNCVLLKIIQKQKRNKPNSQQDYSTTTKIIDANVYEQTDQDTENILNSELKFSINQYCTLQQDTNIIMDEAPIDLCSIHLQKLDIVCLTDRSRICTKCALFGNHKQHEFRSVEDVVKEVSMRAENIMSIYQQIQNKQTNLGECKSLDSLNEKFKNVFKESLSTVKEKFKELHKFLNSKEQKMTDHLNTIVNTLEQQSRKQINEIMNQCTSQVELWKITAKDRLLYFSQTTEIGEIPLDLLNTDISCVEKGVKLLDDIDQTIATIDQRVQSIKIKSLKIDFKMKDIEKSLDSLFSLTLMTQNSTKSSNPDQAQNLNQNPITPLGNSNFYQKGSLNDSMLCTNIQDSKKDKNLDQSRSDCLSKLLSGDAMSSFCYDDPMLLRDASLADWGDIQSEYDQTETNLDQTVQKVDQKQKKTDVSQVTPQKTIDLKKNTTSFKILERIQEKRSSDQMQKQETCAAPQHNVQSSPANKNMRLQFEENKQQQQLVAPSIRQGVSPTPKLPIDKKKKILKINERCDQLWQQLKNDTLETADISNAELQDEGIYFLCECIKVSKKLKTLKAVRNRITDDGACKLLDTLFINPNQQFQSLHLQSNLISEKTLDHLISLIKRISSPTSLPKNIYLNQNLLNITKSKKKIEELKKIGYVVVI